MDFQVTCIYVHGNNLLKGTILIELPYNEAKEYAVSKSKEGKDYIYRVINAKTQRISHSYYEGMEL